MRARCILVAEDEALVAMELQSMLERSGFEVTCFASGEQAEAWLAGNVAAAAVLDIVLRDGPCLQLAAALKSRTIPFIVYSGLPHQPGQVAPPLDGAPYLSKPADIDQVVPKLTALLTEHEAPRG